MRALSRHTFACLMSAAVAACLTTSVEAQWQTIDLEGQVLLPNGKPHPAELVYVMPMTKGTKVRAKGTPTSVDTDGNGMYTLNIEADGAIQLRFGSGAQNYQNLSHLSGNQKINCLLPSSAGQVKANVLSTMLEAAAWGQEWNEYLPKEAIEKGTVVYYTDGNLTIPKKYTVLFQKEMGDDRARDSFWKNDNGQILVRMPEREDKQIHIEYEFQDRESKRGERFPNLKLD